MSRNDDSILRKLGFCLWVDGRFNPSKNCIKMNTENKTPKADKRQQDVRNLILYTSKMRLFSVFWSSVKSGQNTKNLSSAPLPGTFFLSLSPFLFCEFFTEIIAP